ncbi:MAG: PQQ-dependent sugar dehydrogenase [Geminicoccaceae bacterium]
MRRRSMLGHGAAGLGAALVGGLPAEPVRAVEPVANVGPPVALNPLPAIQPSGVAVELVTVATAPATATVRGRAWLSYLTAAPGGQPYLYVNDTRGRIWRVDTRTGAVANFLNLARLRGSAFLGGNKNAGLRSFAFHPDFARGGTAGHRRFFTISTETLASRPSGVTVLAGNYPAAHDAVLAEWTVDASDPPKVFASSRREVLRIALFSGNQADHGADQLMFNPTAVPGTTEYGKLYITVGDGGYLPEDGDPYNQAQDRTSPLGKVLRLNPLRVGSKPFGTPASNPFPGLGGAGPLVWAYGLRHPQHLAFDPVTGTGILTDIGQWQIEEVNLLLRGANYGWPLREGTFAFVSDQPEQLYGLPANDATLGLTYPVAQYDHEEGLPQTGWASGFVSAICGGFVYRGSAVPALQGHYLCGDLVNGRIFHVPLASLVQGQQTPLLGLTLLQNGVATDMTTLVGSTNGRVDLRFGQGADGEVYVMSKQDGVIRRMVAAASTG